MKFTTPPNKDYNKDIRILYDAIKSGENITFSKFCDGELSVLDNKAINNKEFWFDPNNMLDELKRNKLLESIQFKHPNYFVGITCVKVFGIGVHRHIKSLAQQQEDHLTWADILVNSNYRFFVENIMPLFKDRKVVLFCNKNGQVDNLHFKPSFVFPVEHNAWGYNWNYIEEAKSLISNEGLENCLFLFCCGPFGNILAYELTKYNDKNTYLDIGSTLNPWLKSAGFERDYYLGNNFFSNLSGEWDQ